SYVKILKWLTLSLFAYVATAFVVQVPWGEVAHDTFVPTLSWDKDYIVLIVAILGTTISPYLFFWQASEEADNERIDPKAHPLIEAPNEAPTEFRRIEIDTYLGMGFSNIVALFIIITTAATLHLHGITDIQTSEQAAQALRPIAGDFAFAVFALGILGTGLLAVPVLAGSAAYALAEMMRWRAGLDRRPQEARRFYATIVAGTLIGVGINFINIDPIKALFWSAVINGVVAVPLMVVMMVMTMQPKVMGRFTLPRALWAVGWLSTAAMGITVAIMFATW
ncbi:MAG TPA: divalent metal cation transporter, partial [Stellaceae bacterium]|nr:divalent metal cation transporter [Stellaceae bacterium]